MSKENSIKLPVTFAQPSESTPAKKIICHQSKIETFICSLHPAASLYEDVTDEDSVSNCFKKLREYLKSKNIELILVEEALSLDKERMKKLAEESLTYEVDESFKNMKLSEEERKRFDNLLSEEYKRSIINKLTHTQLFNIILTNPTYSFCPTRFNTFIEPTHINFEPIGNLVFCRDQQITTQKGVVIGRTLSSQRRKEHKVMKQVFNNLGSKIVGEVKDGYLEGGDFFVARTNLSMLGVGMRTDMNGANYLMRDDLLGTQLMAIIYDDTDLDQQRMHLDTYFNILDDYNCIVLDFDQCGKVCKKNVNRKVYLFDNDPSAKEINSDNEKVLNKVGNYKLSKIYDSFYTFLEEYKFKMIKVTHEQQVDYMINFLNIGNKTIMAVNPGLKDIVKDLDLTVDYFDFRPILNMYGAMHCMTQVSRV